MDINRYFWGALPFVGSGILTNVFDALFEATSGITATGATMFIVYDDIPKTFVLWRGLMHWIGGMGIIVLILSFLKNLALTQRTSLMLKHLYQNRVL